LAQIKRDSKLSGMVILRWPRLSVAPLTEREFLRVLELGETALGDG
jgi:predicted RNA-binding protein with PUA-like domain